MAQFPDGDTHPARISYRHRLTPCLGIFPPRPLSRSPEIHILIRPVPIHLPSAPVNPISSSRVGMGTALASNLPCRRSLTHRSLTGSRMVACHRSWCSAARGAHSPCRCPATGPMCPPFWLQGPAGSYPFLHTRTVFQASRGEPHCPLAALRKARRQGQAGRADVANRFPRSAPAASDIGCRCQGRDVADLRRGIGDIGIRPMLRILAHPFVMFSCENHSQKNRSESRHRPTTSAPMSGDQCRR